LQALFLTNTQQDVILYVVSPQCTVEIAREPSTGFLLASYPDYSLGVIVYLYQEADGEILLKTSDIPDCSQDGSITETLIYSFGCTALQPQHTSLLNVNSDLDEVALTICSSDTSCTLQTVSLTSATNAATLALSSGPFTFLGADKAGGRWVWSFPEGNTFTIQSQYASSYGYNATTSSYSAIGSLIDAQLYAKDSQIVFLYKNGDVWVLAAATIANLQNVVVLDTGYGTAPVGFSLDQMNGYVVYGFPGCNNVGFEIRAARVPGVMTTPDLTGDNYYKASYGTDRKGAEVSVNLYFSGVLNGLNECLNAQ